MLSITQVLRTEPRSDAIAGNISRIVTLHPLAAAYSATSHPTSPPPITTTFPFTSLSPASTSCELYTKSKSFPGIFN